MLQHSVVLFTQETILECLDIHEIGLSCLNLLEQLPQTPSKARVLKLSNGSQSYKAFELEPLIGLESNSPLNFKCVLHQVLIRRGVLLLNNQNTKILPLLNSQNTNDDYVERLTKKYKQILGISHAPVVRSNPLNNDFTSFSTIESSLSQQQLQAFKTKAYIQSYSKLKLSQEFSQTCVLIQDVSNPSNSLSCKFKSDWIQSKLNLTVDDFKRAKHDTENAAAIVPLITQLYAFLDSKKNTNTVFTLLVGDGNILIENVD
jgi:hypothetical protein